MDLSRFGLYLNFFAKARSLFFSFESSSIELLLLLCSDQSGVPPPRDDGVVDIGGETGGDSDPGEISKLSLNPPSRGRTSKKGFSIENCWLAKFCAE